MLAAVFEYWAIVTPKAAIAKLNMPRLSEQYKRLGVSSPFHERRYQAFERPKVQ